MHYNIIMESFSNDNNSNESLVEKKISLHPLKLYRVYFETTKFVKCRQFLLDLNS